MAANPIRDFALDEDGDMAVLNGDLVPISGEAAVKQGIRIRVLTWLGEIWLDETLGVDYFNQILGIKGVDSNIVRDLLTRAISSTPDVTEVVGVDLVVDANRMGSINYQVRTIYSTSVVKDTISFKVPG